MSRKIEKKKEKAKMTQHQYGSMEHEKDERKAIKSGPAKEPRAVSKKKRRKASGPA